jgi:hypothetical protein
MVDRKTAVKEDETIKALITIVSDMQFDSVVRAADTCGLSIGEFTRNCLAEKVEYFKNGVFVNDDFFKLAKEEQ